MTKLYNLEYNFEGCETNDYHQILLILTDEDIACDVLASITTGENSTDEEEEEQPLSKSKLSNAREALDVFMGIIDSTSEPELQPFYRHFKTAREIIVRKQHQKFSQKKIEHFFKRVSAAAGGFYQFYSYSTCFSFT